MSIYARLLLAHLPAFLIGLGLVELLWPRKGLSDGWIKLTLAPGLGWGVSSSLFFFWCLAVGPARPGYNGLEWGLALGTALAAVLASRPNRRLELSLTLRVVSRPIWRLGLSLPSPAALKPALLPGAAALLSFLILTGLLWLRSAAQPNGNFDAYAIWNLHARFLFLTRAGDWTLSFSPQLGWWTHPDYPLLWPLTLLRGYLSQGRILTQAAVFQAVVFGAAAGGLFCAGLAHLRGRWQAALGALLLLGMPWFVNFSAFQQSDVPLAFYYLAFILLLLLAQERNLTEILDAKGVQNLQNGFLLQNQGGQDGKPDRNSNLGLLVLAGLAAGSAAWTKNDGLVFAAAALAAVLLDVFRSPRPARIPRLAAFASGLLIPLAAVLLFKLVLAPPGDLIGTQTGPELLAKVLDPTRYLAILLALLAQLPTLGGLTPPFAAAFVAGLLLAGLAPRRPSAWLFLPLGLTLLGYCAVYLITPHPLAWHLGYSLDRLCFHLLIPALFLLLARASAPGDLLRAALGSKSRE